MQRRHVPLLPLLLALPAVVGLAACGDDDGATSGSVPDPGSTLPPADVEGEYAHPTGADEVVFEYAERGGFVPREYAFRDLPVVLVSGDGRVFAEGPMIEIYPQPLLPNVQVQTISEAGIQQLLAAADEAGLFRDVEYVDDTMIADASTATVTILVDGDRWTHEAYALGFAEPGAGEADPDRAALAEFLERVGDLPSLIGADELGPQEAFVPDSYRIQALPIEDPAAYGDEAIEPTILDWPASTGVALADAAECALVAASEVGELFASANQLTFFTEGDVTYELAVGPLLPGDTCP